MFSKKFRKTKIVKYMKNVFQNLIKPKPIFLRCSALFIIKTKNVMNKSVAKSCKGKIIIKLVIPPLTPNIETSKAQLKPAKYVR